MSDAEKLKPTTSNPPQPIAKTGNYFPSRDGTHISCVSVQISTIDVFAVVGGCRLVFSENDEAEHSIFLPENTAVHLANMLRERCQLIAQEAAQ